MSRRALVAVQTRSTLLLHQRFYHNRQAQSILAQRTLKAPLLAYQTTATGNKAIQRAKATSSNSWGAATISARGNWIHTTSSVHKPHENQKSPYLRISLEKLPAQALDIDLPYPEAGEDGYLTISFYSFFEIPEETVMKVRDRIQKEWAELFGIVGRIYVYEQGINAQLSIPHENAQPFRKWLEDDPMFSGRIPRFNWALEHRKAFKSFHVRVRQLVATGEDLELGKLCNEPEYLSPQAWESELIQVQAHDPSSRPLLIDMRNNYEFRIGKFEGAVCPDVDTFREEMDVVRDMCKDQPKDRPIYMYCTGGIRCSVAGAILKSEGYENIKTLQGGVISYGRYVKEKGPNAKSIYHGKNFTFDKRLGEEVTNEVLAKCDQCGSPCDIFTNCANKSCNLLFIQCPSCAEKHHHTCGSKTCIERAQMSHDELVKHKFPPLWNYHVRVRPEKVFKNGVAHPELIDAVASS